MERKSTVFLTSMRTRAGRRGKQMKQDYDLCDRRGIASGLLFIEVSTNRIKGLTVQHKVGEIS